MKEKIILVLLAGVLALGTVTVTAYAIRGATSTAYAAVTEITTE